MFHYNLYTHTHGDICEIFDVKPISREDAAALHAPKFTGDVWFNTRKPELLPSVFVEVCSNHGDAHLRLTYEAASRGELRDFYWDGTKLVRIVYEHDYEYDEEYFVAE